MDLLNEVENFYNNFDGEKGIIGRTVKGKPIYYMAIKKSNYPKIIVQCSIHAREYITTYLCLKLIKSLPKLIEVGCVYFIPLLNADGVEICLNQFPLYKANANGVDLNVNFDARFGKGEKNVFLSGAENYVGKHPFSEPESKALRDFTYKIKPHLTISYHSKGQEIYYEFHQGKKRLERDLSLAKKVSKICGYKIKSTPFSCGGYKDWCIEKLKIPALTIEVGDDNLTHPIGKSSLTPIYQENKMVLPTAIDWLKGEYMTEKYMKSAIKQAKIALKKDEVPIGAVIVLDGKIIARAHNLMEKTQLATAHAEILAINKACKKLNSWRLDNAEIYVTVEPCAMCAGAIANARIKKVYFGAYEHKSGCAQSKYPVLSDNGLNHKVDYCGGVLEKICANLIKNYFKDKRSGKKS